ncbi:actin-like ATPase domain-containing protein [Podospora aff. communis PSN243]|uniref:Actin-like ATPase domain-containing protein n=1 Tax=Podospora aff. communis PSN243 TaxID=3040156 RepID=A0AAV9GGA5_9PEZI|nr:actin-like ATPase domain-containing protein [Podospora aff. communis PSN243]
MSGEQKLVIALDFGTTFSGVAFCFLGQRDTKVSAVMSWPGAEGQSVPKIPTLINYGGEGLDGQGFTWGASVSRLDNNIVGVKLLLDPQQEQPKYLPAKNIHEAVRELPKPAVKIAADFIGAVYKHALGEIAKRVPKRYFDICEKHFVLSVPAVWSDKAKNATLEFTQAAKLAGLDPITLIKAPEAAALYTMRDLDLAVNVDDVYVVCDAGGGTVDLISYEVVAKEPNLQLREIVPGTGGMAGSLGVNKRFEEAVKELVGKTIFADLRVHKGYGRAMQMFDRDVKRPFNGDPDEDYYVSFRMAGLEDNTEAGLEGNDWTMKGHESIPRFAQIFEPAVADVLALIDRQGIFLVGGFGSSRYLESRVKEKFPLPIEVMQPSDAWAAIVKGAALSKLPGQATVVSTSATKHYGVEAWSVFDYTIDVGMPSQVGEYDGIKRAQRMTWYIKIGDSIERDKRILCQFYRDLPGNYKSADLQFTSQLYECSDAWAPVHRREGYKIGPNCLLHADLRSVPKKYFRKRSSTSIKIHWGTYEVHYDLVVEIKSALMTFSRERNGKAMGSVTASFN